MLIQDIITLAKNDQLTGHLFMRPFLWYCKQVDVIFAPFPTSASGRDQLIDAITRIALVASFFLSTFALAGAAIGLGIKKIAHLLSPQIKPIVDQTPLLPSDRDPVGVVEDLFELERQMDVMLLNVATICGEAGEKFQRTVRRFEEKYEKGVFPSADTKIEELKLLFEQLKQWKPGLFLEELLKAPLMENSGVIQAPADGNCFFHASGRGLTMLEPELRKAGKWVDGPLDHVNLRQRVVAWMKDHIYDPILQEHIRNGIESYAAIYRNQYEIEHNTLMLLKEEGQDTAEALRDLSQKSEELNQLQGRNCYSLYFEKISTPGFFASDAERYAVSQMYQVAIAVHRKIGERIVDGFDPTIFPHNNHYSSFMLLRMMNRMYHIAIATFQKISRRLTGAPDPAIPPADNCPYSFTLLHVDGIHFDLVVPSSEPAP